MKKIILIIAVVIITVSANAQAKGTSSSNTSFSLGLEAALPVGILGEIYSFGIGGSGQVDYKVSELVALTLNAGYTQYVIKSELGGGGIGYIPVLGGIKYHFSPKVYGSGQLGVTFFSEGGNSSFNYVPGIGFKFGNNLDALLKYLGLSSDGFHSSAVGLRLGYTFGNN